MNKRGDKVLSIYWFAILFIVAGAIIYMASNFYSTPFDVRAVESTSLSDQVANCLTSGGYFNDSVLTSDFKNNFVKDCRLNFSTEDVYDWKTSLQYYVEVGVYKPDSSSFNFLGSQVADIVVGDPNIKTTWQLSVTKSTQTSQGGLAGVIAYISNALTGHRTVNTIVIHATEGSTTQGATSTIEEKGLSIHYMIDRTGYIYSKADAPAEFASAFVNENDAAAHAGCGTGTDKIPACTSQCVTNNLLNPSCENQEITGTAPLETCCIDIYNPISIGIELVNLGNMNKFCTGSSTDSSLCSTAESVDGGEWQTYTPEQMTALVNLVSNIAERYNIPLDREHIIGHYQITTKKTDPGPAFPWDSFMKQLKERQGISGVQEIQTSTSKNLPQGVSRSFYTVDKNGNQYIVQVLAIVKKTEKNV